MAWRTATSRRADSSAIEMERLLALTRSPRALRRRAARRLLALPPAKVHQQRVWQSAKRGVGASRRSARSIWARPLQAGGMASETRTAPPSLRASRPR